MSDIPLGFVDKFFRMNPQTDDLLVDGKEIEEGMILLAESDDHRVPIPSKDEPMDAHTLQMALKYNRWFRVSKIQMVGGDISFIATYGDDTKRKRYDETDEAWFVRKDSIEEALGMAHYEKTFARVYHVVCGAMCRQEESDHSWRSGKKHDWAVEASQQILGILDPKRYGLTQEKTYDILLTIRRKHVGEIDTVQKQRAAFMEIITNAMSWKDGVIPDDYRFTSALDEAVKKIFSNV